MSDRDIPERMRVHLALCAYRNVTARTSHLWARSIPDLATKHDITLGAWSGDALISRARSVLLSAFLDKCDRDVLVWVDADISWRLPSLDPVYEGDLARLARSVYKTRGIVGGVYAKRTFGGGCAIRPAEGASIKTFKTGTDLLIPAHTVSTGFFGIHREGLQKIAKALPYVSDDNGSYQPFCLPYLDRYSGGLRFLSEDWALCMRGHEAGVSCHIDAMPVLGHEGEHVYTVGDASPQNKRG